MTRAPSPSQWRIVLAAVETGRLRRSGRRFVADEQTPRSFGFTQVVQLVPKGLVRLADAECTAVVPTALSQRLAAQRAQQEAQRQ